MMTKLFDGLGMALGLAQKDLKTFNMVLLVVACVMIAMKLNKQDSGSQKSVRSDRLHEYLKNPIYHPDLRENGFWQLAYGGKRWVY